MKKEVILITILTLIVPLTFVNAAVISANNSKFDSGDWNLYIIPLNSSQDNNALTDSYNQFKQTYITAKNNCGLSSDFYIIKNDYAVALNATKPACHIYENYFSPDVYTSVMEFDYAFINYLNNPNIYLKSSNLNYNKFSFELNNTINSYFLVIEELDSNKEIYFSNLIKSPLKNENNYTIKTLNLKEDNSMELEFDNPTSQIQKSNFNIFYIYLIILILVFIIILILYIKLKKPKEVIPPFDIKEENSMLLDT